MTFLKELFNKFSIDTQKVMDKERKKMKVIY